MTTEPKIEARHREALERMAALGECVANSYSTDDAAALREILAMLEQAEKVEPVAYVAGMYGGRLTIQPIDTAAVLPEGLALYTTPPADVARDAVRLRAIWEGASGGDDHPISRAMLDAPEPNTYEEFIDAIDAAVAISKSGS